MTIYLVRHGSAGTRNDVDPDDTGRELDDTGKVQADKLAQWLSHEPITHVVSSPYPRCVQTVGPLADQLGIEVVTDAAISEGAAVQQAWALVSKLADATAVLCSHGDVIPELVRLAQLRGMYVPGKSGCAKGSVWTLQHWDGDRFATGIYTPIPG